MAWIQLAAAGYLIGDYIYHRWVEDWLFPPEVKPAPIKELAIPRTDEGATIPLLFGRCRVKSPVLVWIGEVSEEPGSVGNGAPDADVIYRATVMFVICASMGDSVSTNNIHAMWAGEKKFAWLGPFASDTYLVELAEYGDDGYIGSSLQFYDGDSAQELVDSSGNYVSGCVAGQRMLAAGVDPDEIPGYRGYLSALLYNNLGGFYFGGSPSIPAYSFEVSSYAPTNGVLSAFSVVGQDLNPINALYDLLVAKFGKAGVDFIDIDNFAAAQYTLHTESHGYSRVIDNATELDAHISEILKQIDAALYEDPIDGLLKIKLIRNDYNPTTIPHITKESGCKLLNFAIGSWTDVPNKIRLVFTNRDDDYRDGSAVAQNLANFAIQGEIIERVIRMPGVCYQALADRLVAREMAALCRPNIKCRVEVDRSFLRVTQGDAVKLTWEQPDIPGLIFRVANVDRGMLADNKIVLDLILDYFYVWRNQSPRGDIGVGGLGDNAPINVHF